MVWFSNIHTEKNEIREFQFFGKKMRALAILTFIADILMILANLVSGLLVFINFMLGIGASLNVQNADENLAITELKQFQVRYRIYLFSNVLSSFFIPFALAGVYRGLPFLSFLDYRLISEMLMDFFPSLVTVIIVYTIIGIFELRAWRIMVEFFNKYSYMFEPCDVSQASKGCKYLRYAGFCYLLSFSVISIPIGVVLRMIGHLKLSTLTKALIPLEDG